MNIENVNFKNIYFKAKIPLEYFARIFVKKFQAEDIFFSKSTRAIFDVSSPLRLIFSSLSKNNNNIH